MTTLEKAVLKILREAGEPLKLEVIGDRLLDAGYSNADEAEDDAAAVINDLQIQRLAKWDVRTNTYVAVAR